VRAGEGSVGAAEGRMVRRNADSLTPETLRELLAYEPETGVFRWLQKTSRATVGDVAGAVRGRGYLAVCIRGTQHYSHRLAFYWMTGQWPEGVVDHKDGNRKNNAWSNLRDVSKSINGQNQRRATSISTTGLLGAHRCRGKFKAEIVVNRIPIHIGVFDSASLAHEAYLKVKRELHEGCTI